METTKSEQTPKQIADQAWRNQIMQRVEWINERVSITPSLGDYIYFQIGQQQSDYKQALREAVQNMINKE